MNSHVEDAFPMIVSVVVTSAAQLSSVYALLGGVSPNVLTSPGRTLGAGAATADVKPATASSSVPSDMQAESPVPSESGLIATSDVSPSDEGDIDAHGWPWSEAMHASTKGKTKDGLWRMKVGVTRPDPKPGFPIGGSTPDTGTEVATSPTTVTSPAAAEAAPVPSATTDEDEDEFAAFRTAAAKSDAEDAAAKASVPARTWTDADLGALCNQAAVKLGDPAPVKAIINEFVPEGQVPHSRNIPTDRRAEFAAAIEAKAGIEFAG